MSYSEYKKPLTATPEMRIDLYELSAELFPTIN